MGGKLLYAIFESGGKQIQASPGERVRVEKLEAEVGSKVRFERVLLLNRDGKIQVGKPYLDGTIVVGTVLEQDRHRKILVFKKKRRKQYRRTHGHRQPFTAIEIEKIEGEK